MPCMHGQGHGGSASTTMGVSQRRSDERSPHLEQVCEHAPANARAGYLPDAAGHDGRGDVLHRIPSISRSGEQRTLPPMDPIAEERQQGQASVLARADVAEHYIPESRSAVLRRPRSRSRSPEGSGPAAVLRRPRSRSSSPTSSRSQANTARSSETSRVASVPPQWLLSSSMQEIIDGLSLMNDTYGISPQTSTTLVGEGDAEDKEGEESELSPPLRPIRDFHAPRTSLTKEEFTLAAVGITISVTDGDPAKTVSAVKGGASVAGVHVCDELVAINGVDVSLATVNGFDCIEVCQQAVREGGRSSVSLGVRDFCSMKLKQVEVEVAGGCPAMRLLRERNSPLCKSSLPPTPAKQMPTPRTSQSPRVIPEISLYHNANGDGGRYGSRPSSLNTEDWEDDVIMHKTTRGGAMPRTHSRDRMLPDSMPPTPEADAESMGWGAGGGGGGGYTWSVPSAHFWKLVAVVVVVAVAAAVYLRDLDKEELLTRLISSIDWLEGVVQTLPLCPCTYWIRGSIVTVPLCRVCKPKVLRYHNYNNNAGLSLEKRGKGLCDLRPAWMMGKCRRSTETTKYLGTFGTYEECEAACLSYNVGRVRCRTLTYYGKAFPDRKFRQTCFALTHTVRLV